jgi:drug/metabolite transporter (DMT)-like permease
VDREIIKGHIAILSSKFIVGLNVPVGRYLLSGWISPMELALTRILFGAIAFWVIGLFSKKEKVAFSDLAIIATGGIVGIVATQLTFSWGLTFTTPVNFALIVALNPIVVLLLSTIFLKEAINGKKIAGVILGISGAILIISQTGNNSTGENNIAGVCFAIANTLMLATYLIIARKIVAKYSPVTLAKWMFLFATIALAPFAIWDLPTQKIYSGESNLQVLLLLSFTLIFATVLNNLLVPVALKRIRPIIASIYNNLQPVIASVVAIWIGQDIFSWDKPLAALLVISGVVIINRNEEKHAF